MQKIKILGSSTAILVLTVMGSAGGAVYARQGVKEAPPEDSSSVAAEPKTLDERQQEAADAATRHAELQHKGNTIADDLRKEHGGAKTPQERQKQCESHKHGLTTKFNRIVTNSQRSQTRIDKIFSKAQAYQKAKNLQPAGYDQLIAAAQAAQTASANSIASLKGVTPSIDCNSTSVAADVAAFKAAAETTRDNLKTYRTSVKAVLKALQAVKPAAADKTGGAQ